MTRETAIKQWSATFKVSRPWAQGGDTAGRDARATDFNTRVRSRALPPEDASVFRGALLLFLAWLSAL